MPITKEAKRVKTGQSLTDFKNQAISAISQLEAIKKNLINLKSSVNSDSDFTTEDEVEIQGIITDLATRVQSII